MFDACHMLKLARNIIAGEATISNSQNRKIEWSHFQKLENVRLKNNFVTHKLNKKHIEFERNKMKVNIAAQTLSSSVANSLEFLMKSEQPSFKNCAGTIEYARKINDLFDILNTGFHDTLDNNNNNIFKTPICKDTEQQIFTFLDESFDYISSLEFDGQYVIHSKKKTGFLGFLIDIVALKSIYNDYVKTGKLNSVDSYDCKSDLCF